MAKGKQFQNCDRRNLQSARFGGQNFFDFWGKSLHNTDAAKMGIVGVAQVRDRVALLEDSMDAVNVTSFPEGVQLEQIPASFHPMQTSLEKPSASSPLLHLKHLS